jgi:RNA polymerase sigma-70 factor (ECF subfamily)
MKAVMEAQNSQRILVQRAQKGGREAFDAIVRVYEGDLQRYARSRIGGHLKSKVEVDDVLQETFSRAWKSVGDFRWTGEGAFLAWLKGIVEHVILKLVSQRSRDRIIYRQEDRGSDDPTPSKNLRRGERFDRLEEALKKLSPEYREAVRLVRVQGLQIKEAAQRMNRTPKAVMHLVSRGLKKLRETMGDTESFHLPPERLEGTGGKDDAV